MKTCIVTVYNTHNCGSFLQAKALADTVSNLGNDVYFLERDNSENNSLKSHIITAVKKFLRGNISIAINEMKINRTFNKAVDCFNIITDTSDMDCIIYGSDTIWNLNAPYFRKNIKKYFGLDVNKTKIAYAPSIANTKVEIFQNEKIIKALNDFKSLSSRDERTSQMILSTTGRIPTDVCDPTMLFDKQYYCDTISDLPKIDNEPIFIYYFGKMDKDNIARIKSFAKKNNRQIVSMGRDCNWADKFVPIDPYLFLQYFRDSSYVITNTFHGTIFSLIFNKDFLCLGKGKAKVKHLIDTVGANYILASNDDDISSILGTSIDYTNINEIMNKLTNQSIDYLKESLNEI